MSTKTELAKHTPTPWVAKHSGTGDATVIATPGWKYRDGSPHEPVIIDRIDWPTAQYLVTAVNTYAARERTIADLVTALEGLLPMWESGIKEPWVEAARAALDRSKGTVQS